MAGQGHRTAAALHSPGGDGSPAPGVGDVRGPSVGRVPGRGQHHPGVHRSALVPRALPVWSPRSLCAGGRTFCADQRRLRRRGSGRAFWARPTVLRGSAVRCAPRCASRTKSFTATTSSCCNTFVDEAEFERLYGPWDPLDPAEAQEFLADFPGPWWVVGGWAVEAFSESTASTTTWTWRSSSTTCLPCSTWWETGTTCGA